MEKIIGRFTLGAVVLFSGAVLAGDLEYVDVYGSATQGNSVGNVYYNTPEKSAPSYNGVGVHPPEFQQGQANQDKSKAESMEKAKKYCEANGYPVSSPICAGFKKEKECNTVKSGAPIDQRACMEDVRYRGDILTNAQCGSASPTRTSGTFSWNYTFQGNFYGFRANIPAQSYDEFSWSSDQLACERIISNAVTHIQANCGTQADYAIHEKCN
jgi:hypothetical protein